GARAVFELARGNFFAVWVDGRVQRRGRVLDFGRGLGLDRGEVDEHPGGAGVEVVADATRDPGGAVCRQRHAPTEEACSGLAGARELRPLLAPRPARAPK